MNNFHEPVLVKQVLNYLKVKPGEKYIDATLGGGGHTLEILKRGGIVLGIDQDPEAISYAKKRLSAYPAPQISKNKILWGQQSFLAVNKNFSYLSAIGGEYRFTSVAGILFDLGTSAYQLTQKHRGFSFLKDAPLDMRMDPSLSVTAKDLVNGLGKKELYELFTKLAQEKRARAIAAAIVRTRQQKTINTTKELAQIIEKVYRGQKSRPALTRPSRGRIHPATKAFQALRMAVNDERHSLKTALPQALNLLKHQGRLVVISFHEGEDRIVKNFFKDNRHQIKILTKKPVIPERQELIKNPRSRSAKLRAGEKID